MPINDADIQRLRLALDFYAFEDNWTDYPSDLSPARSDRGAIARAALSGDADALVKALRFVGWTEEGRP